MNYSQMRQELIDDGYSPREAEEILEEEIEFERLSKRDREIEDEWDKREKEKQK